MATELPGWMQVRAASPVFSRSRWAARTGLFPSASRRRGRANAGSLSRVPRGSAPRFSMSCSLSVFDTLRHVAGVVGALARLEVAQLLDDVVVVLARDARDLVLAREAAEVAHRAQRLVGLRACRARPSRGSALKAVRRRLLRGEVVRPGRACRRAIRSFDHRRHLRVAAPAFLEVAAAAGRGSARSGRRGSGTSGCVELPFGPWQAAQVAAFLRPASTSCAARRPRRPAATTQGIGTSSDAHRAPSKKRAAGRRPRSRRRTRHGSANTNTCCRA